MRTKTWFREFVFATLLSCFIRFTLLSCWLDIVFQIYVSYILYTFVVFLILWEMSVVCLVKYGYTFVVFYTYRIYVSYILYTFVVSECITLLSCLLHFCRVLGEFYTFVVLAWHCLSFYQVFDFISFVNFVALHFCRIQTH